LTIHLLHSMTDAIRHRGPDSDGYWVDADAGIALGHRRLAIVDLSAAGAQPMVSSSGRYIIAFNGEIYNHQLLRKDLGVDICWRGHSDTETLLAGFDRWGVEATVTRSIGMFAFAVWDKLERSLTLGRDRVGEKPLYYGWQGKGQAAVFLFGSELKALRVHPAFDAVVDRDSLCNFLRYNNVGGARSIYDGIHKLLPGNLLKITNSAPQPVLQVYWSGPTIATQGLATPFTGTGEEAVATLEALLLDAVGQQMMADVPLGAFLSGGVDSSTVVAMMQAQSVRPIKTFTVGFDDARYDESTYATAVAKHLRTEHTEMFVTPTQAMDVIALLPTIYDEPFADSSQIPTLLVSQLARQHVKVSLSGDAGDELFCGYNRYKFGGAIWSSLAFLPRPIRHSLAWLLTRMSSTNISRLMSFVHKDHLSSNIGEKLHKGANILEARELNHLYQTIASQWHDPASVVVSGNEPAESITTSQLKQVGLSNVECMMMLDLLTYLPNDILTKVDRAAMSTGLETRVPFLDHRVVKFAWTLPQHMKLRKGEGKWILRQVLRRHVPNHLIERPKMGFGIPLGDWLRGPLRGWAENLLSESRLQQDGYFKPEVIRQKWMEHLSCTRNWEHHLWNILMFQVWLENQHA
jgi:asparagine synthase (glutamine-hydrolysing)